MAEDEPLRTALHDRHVAMEAAMGDEAGWRVPLSYRGALVEAAAVRVRAGVFDLSHFGRIRIRGDGALDLLERVCTGDVAHQEDDTTLETLLCNERGGILDSCRLIRLASFWVLVSSPPARRKVLAHLLGLAEQFGAKVDDQTLKTSMLAASGPAAAEILDGVLPFRPSALPNGAVKFGSLLIARYIAERVSLTGEWGVCVQVPNMAAAQAWRFITDKAGADAVAPCGMAALDILRIEAGLPRYGHEINETVDPIMAGLERRVDGGRDFIGAAAVRKITQTGAARKLAGLVLKTPVGAAEAGARICRQGAGVFRADGAEAGVVTSGTFSPALDAPVAMAYVARDLRADSEVLVEVGEGRATAKVTKLPFVGVRE